VSDAHVLQVASDLRRRDRRADACLPAQRRRFKTTIVERAPDLRPGGYAIDFWGD